MYCVGLAEEVLLSPILHFFGCRDKTVPMIVATKKLISKCSDELSIRNFPHRYIDGKAIFVPNLTRPEEVLTEESRTK